MASPSRIAEIRSALANHLEIFAEPHRKMLLELVSLAEVGERARQLISGLTVVGATTSPLAPKKRRPRPKAKSQTKPSKPAAPNAAPVKPAPKPPAVKAAPAAPKVAAPKAAPAANAAASDKPAPKKPAAKVAKQKAAAPKAAPNVAAAKSPKAVKGPAPAAPKKSVSSPKSKPKKAVTAKASTAPKSVPPKASAPPPAPASAGAASDKPTLRQILLGILGKSATPLSLKDIGAKVAATGHKSSSANFAKVLSVALSNLKEVKRVDKGVYALKAPAT